MFDNVLKKVRFEMELLVVVVIFSLSLSSLLIADAAVGFVLRAEQYGLALIAFRICEFTFALIWLFYSINMTLEINKFRRKYFRTFFLRKLKRLEEEQKKSAAIELVRDIVAFYRGYYTRVMAVLALAIAVGSSIFAAVAYLFLYGYMSFWEAIFRWMLSSVMLLSASAFYIYVHRSWGRKLLRVKDSEKKLSEILGGPIEG